MNKSTTVQLLKSLINIDSQSHNKIGVKEIQGLVADVLLEMGFEINWIKSPINPHEFLLHAQLKSLQPYAKAASFICHADTALSLQSHFQLSENKIFGTGCADNKGGIVTGLYAISELLNHEAHLPFDINFLVSPNEEIGSPGFHSFLNKIGEESALVLGLEPALANGNLIKSRSGNRWYQLKISGISAHSGRINIPKLNSLHEAINKTQNILELAEKHPSVRFNVNSLSTSSDLYNTIPAETNLKLDLRFEKNFACDFFHDKLVSTFEHSFQRCSVSDTESKSTWTITDFCPAMEEKETMNDHYKEIESILRDITKNDDLTLDHSWGAADISHMSFPHNLTIDGLGPVGAGMHRNDEYIFSDSIFERALLIVKILNYLKTQQIFELPRRDYESNLFSIGSNKFSSLSNFEQIL